MGERDVTGSGQDRVAVADRPAATVVELLS